MKTLTIITFILWAAFFIFVLHQRSNILAVSASLARIEQQKDSLINLKDETIKHLISACEKSDSLHTEIETQLIETISIYNPSYAKNLEFIKRK